MSNIQAASMRASPVEPTPSKPALAPMPPQAGDPAGFASLLRQTQNAHAPSSMPLPPSTVHESLPGPTPPPASASQGQERGAEPGSEPGSESGADADAAPDAEPMSRSEARLTAAHRAAANVAQRSPRPAGRVVAADASDATDAPDSASHKTDSAAAASRSASDSPVASAWMQWLAGQQRSAVPPADAGPARSERELNGASAQAGTGDSTGAADGVGGTHGAAVRAGAAPNDRAGSGKALGARDFAAALTDPGASPTADPSADPTAIAKSQAREAIALAGFKDAAASFAAAAAAWTPSVARGFTTTPPVAVTLAAPVNAPEFAQALGVQISVLAQDSVQHAELHLNPPDMGPVSVQIVMDGTQARVDFGADLAATRHAIEAGLPALASALRDAGFTLAGGGVSQHSRGRGDSDGAAGTTSLRTRRTDAVDADDELAGARRAVPRTMTIGGLDLYA